MKKIWNYALNVILSVTANSFRMALSISTFHYNVLKSKIAIPFILGLYNAYEPVHTNYVTNYNGWKVKLAFQKSKTTELAKKLGKDLTDALNTWIGAILQVYSASSTEYKALIPNGRKPFRIGTQDERIEAIRQLSLAIGTDVALAAVKAQVDTFYNQVELLFEAQKGAIADVTTASNTLETARIEMSNAQFADIGLLMAHYVTNLVYIEQFFDLRRIRERVQLLFEGTVKKLSIKKIVERTVLPDDMVTFENTGVTELRFYKSATKDGAIGPVFVTVVAGAETTIKASEVGDVALKFWMVYNPDDINKGEFVMEFV